MSPPFFFFLFYFCTKRYASGKDTYGELKDFPALSVALESKVIAERESLFTTLKETTSEMVGHPTYIYPHQCSILSFTAKGC